MMTLPPDTAALVERLQGRLTRADEAEAGRKALIVKFNTDYSPEADEAIRDANDKQMVAKAMLSADAVHSLPSLLATIEAQARQIAEADHNLRDRIDRGLRAFCSETPDFDMSPAMRRDAADFIMGQSIVPPLPDTGQAKDRTS